jgi:integrase
LHTSHQILLFRDDDVVGAEDNQLILFGRGTGGRDGDTALCLENATLGADTVSAMRQVLSAVLGSAVLYELLTKNPVLGVKLPKSEVANKRKRKPNITPEEFCRLLAIVQEPYSTMIFVSVFSGLRISELIGLPWEDVTADSLTVDERCCRGDWSGTKTDSSSATIAISSAVSARLQRLRTLEIDAPWGGQGAKKKIKAVRSDGPHDLVFQSLRRGAEMNDQNLLRRHLRPAALRLGIDPKKATWCSLRTFCATWMIEAGADPKSVQAQMRHSRISTTMDIYAQVVPESQRKAVDKTANMVAERFRLAQTPSQLVQ